MDDANISSTCLFGRQPDAKRAPETMSRQGYQLLHWADLDFNYWAVSDVNVNDLQTFKQQFEAQTSRH